MIYKPTTGSLWDPSVFWHAGQYYAIMMYNPAGPDGLGGATCGLIAQSADGVHWRDGWTVTPEPTAPHGGKFYKAFIGRSATGFIMNHAVLQPNGQQDTLRYYQSIDLRNWTCLGSNMPDPTWYIPTGRWDCMYVIPKEEDAPSHGYYGYVTATPKPGLPRGFGLCESADGRSWRVLPPPVVDWGNVPPKDLEVGGVERIAGKYVMIGDHAGPQGTLVYTLIADAPEGPFRPDAGTHCLCGNLTLAVDPCGHLWRATQLAAWARCRDGEKLISNYVQALSGTWMLPLRKPVFADGHLRLGWWSENDRLKGKELPLSASEVKPVAAGCRMAHRLEVDWDRQVGLVLEGTLKAHPATRWWSGCHPSGPPTPVETTPAAGFAFPGRDGQWLELRLELGQPGTRCTRLGWWDPGTGFAAADVIGHGCASVAGIAADIPHTFRLLIRQGLFELYVDDLLVQTYFLNEHWDGTFGFLAVDATAEFATLKAWRMTVVDGG